MSDDMDRSEWWFHGGVHNLKIIELHTSDLPAVLLVY